MVKVFCFLSGWAVFFPFQLGGQPEGKKRPSVKSFFFFLSGWSVRLSNRPNVCVSTNAAVQPSSRQAVQPPGFRPPAAGTYGHRPYGRPAAGSTARRSSLPVARPAVHPSGLAVRPSGGPDVQPPGFRLPGCPAMLLPSCPAVQLSTVKPSCLAIWPCSCPAAQSSSRLVVQLPSRPINN